MPVSGFPRFFYTAAILLQVLLLPACGRVLSVEPLSALSDSPPDTEVDGMWVLPEKRPRSGAFILMVSAIGSNRQEAVWVEHRPGEILNSARIYLYPTRIGGRKFASIKVAPSAERNRADRKFENNFTFVTYSVVSDRLRISELRVEVFERGIESGALKGSIKQEGMKWIELVDSTENIRKFVEENLDKIHDAKETLEFTRAEVKAK